MDEDETFPSDPKYKNYVQAIDRSLKIFEYSSEWADLISALTKLNKVISQHASKYQVLPRRLLLSKRLAQCLHPNLPSGVHLKALETYDLIFRSIGLQKLSTELYIYSTGLFPLWSYANISVRPYLLTIFETHFIPLGCNIKPALDGLLHAILSGMEEGSDHYERTVTLLQKISSNVGATFFYTALWLTMGRNPAVRLAGINYVLQHVDLSNGNRSSNQSIMSSNLTLTDSGSLTTIASGNYVSNSVYGAKIQQVITSLVACLKDNNILVQRSSLELILKCFPLSDESTLLETQKLSLICATLHTLLRRDMSLNRRLYSWLLGTEGSKDSGANTDNTISTVTMCYFTTYSKPLLIKAIQAMLRQDATSETFRILVSLLDKSEVDVLDDVFLDVIRSFYIMEQNEKQKKNPGARTQVQDVGKVANVSSSSESLVSKTANLFFSNLIPNYIFEYVGRMFQTAFKGKFSKIDHANEESLISADTSYGPVKLPGSGCPGVHEMCYLLRFLLDIINLPTIVTLSNSPLNEELPKIFEIVVNLMSEFLSQLTDADLVECLNILRKVVSKIQPSLDDDDLSSANKDEDDFTSSSDDEFSDTCEPTDEGTETDNASVNFFEASIETIKLKTEEEKDEVASELDSLNTPIPFHTVQLYLKFYEMYFEQKIYSRHEQFIGECLDTEFNKLLRPDKHVVFQEESKFWLAKDFERVVQLSFNEQKQRQLNPVHKAKSSSRHQFSPFNMSQFLHNIVDEISSFHALNELLVDLSSMPSACGSELRKRSHSDAYNSGRRRVRSAEDNELLDEVILPRWLKVLLITSSQQSGVFPLPLQLQAVSTFIELANLTGNWSLINDKSKQAKSRTVLLIVPLMKESEIIYIKRYTFALEAMTRFLWENLDASTTLLPSKILTGLYNLSPSKVERTMISYLVNYEGFSRLIHLLQQNQEFGSGTGSGSKQFDDCILKLLDNLQSSSPKLKSQVEDWVLRQISCSGGSTATLNNSGYDNNIRKIVDPLLLILLDEKTHRVGVVKFRAAGSIESTGTEDDTEKGYSQDDEFYDFEESYDYKANKKVDNNMNIPQLMVHSRANSTPDLRALAETSADNTSTILAGKDLLSPPNLGVRCRSTGELNRSVSVPEDKDQPDCAVSEKSLEFSFENSVNSKLESLKAPKVDLPKRRRSPGLRLAFDIAQKVVSKTTELISNRHSSGEHNVPENVETVTNPGVTPKVTRKLFPIHPHQTHLLVYPQVYDESRILYALNHLHSILHINPKLFLISLATTNINSTERQVILRMLNCHHNSVKGLGFSNTNQNYNCSMYLEVLLRVLLGFTVGVYSNTGSSGEPITDINEAELNGNVAVQVKSLEILREIVLELAGIIRGSHSGGTSTAAAATTGFQSFLADVLSKIKLNKTLIQSVQSSLTDFTEKDLTFSEEILKFNYGEDISILQIQLLRLTTAVIILEDELRPSNNYNLLDQSRHHALTISQNTLGNAPTSLKYVPHLRLSQQPMFLNAILSALKSAPCSQHPHWTSMVTQVLPYLKANLTQVVVLTMTQLCKNIDISTAEVNYIIQTLDALINISHWILLSSSASTSGDKGDKKNSAESGYLYNLLTAFLPSTGSKSPVPGSQQGSVAHDGPTTPGVQNPHQSQARDDLLSRLDIVISTCSKVWERFCQEEPKKAKLVIHQKLLDLINPIAHNYTSSFISSLALIAPNMNLVEIIYSMKVIRLEVLTTLMMTLVKVNSNEILMQFYSMYLEKFGSLSAANDVNLATVIGLLREGLNLSPQYLLISVEILYKILTKGIVVCGGAAGNAIATSKTELKELQDISQKLLEQVAIMAGNTDTSWLKKRKTENIPDVSVASLKCLGDYMPDIIDLLWGSGEDYKEKILPILTHIIYQVLPNFKMRKTENYKYVLQLIAQLSSFAYLRKAWKKEIFEILLDSNFFIFESENLPNWKKVMDNLCTQDKSTFSELITRVTVPQSGSLNLFASKEREYEERAMLLKRLAFVVWSSEKDQFLKFIQNIQERLAEALKIPQGIVPSIQSSVFLCFRVMLARFSSNNLSALWPIIMHELVQVLLQLEKELHSSSIGGQKSTLSQQSWLYLYLQALKLLELTLNFPSDLLPIFQMYRWSFMDATGALNESGVASLGTSTSTASTGELVNEDSIDVDMSETSSSVPSTGSNVMVPFVPHIARLSNLIPQPSCSSIPPTLNGPLIATQLTDLSELYGFFQLTGAGANKHFEENSHCDFISCNKPRPGWNLEDFEKITELDFLE